MRFWLAPLTQQWCSFALSHLFVQDTDEEEPLAGSQSCSGLVWTAAVCLLQSLKPLEALVSYSEETKSQWKWQKSNVTQWSVNSKSTTGISQLHALENSIGFNLMKGHRSEPMKSYQSGFFFFKFMFSRAGSLSSSFSSDYCSVVQYCCSNATQIFPMEIKFLFIPLKWQRHTAVWQILSKRSTYNKHSMFTVYIHRDQQCHTRLCYRRSHLN